MTYIVSSGALNSTPTNQQLRVGGNVQVQRETYDRLGTVLSISRGCVAACPYGCYYYNYGPTTVVCISCCRSPGCNVGNTAVSCRPVAAPPTYLILLILLLMMQSDSFCTGWVKTK